MFFCGSVIQFKQCKCYYYNCKTSRPYQQNFASILLFKRIMVIDTRKKKFPVCSSMCTLWMITLPVAFWLAQFLKSDLMRQFDSQVNDFMDSLIEESASLEPASVSAVFSPPLSDKERSKLRCGLSTSPVYQSNNRSVAGDWCHSVFLQAFSASPWPGQALCQSQVPPRVSPHSDLMKCKYFYLITEGHWNICLWQCTSFSAAWRLFVCCTKSNRQLSVFLQWAVWGEPHQDNLPHVYCPAHSLYSQYTGGRLHWWRQVM